MSNDCCCGDTKDCCNNIGGGCDDNGGDCEDTAGDNALCKNDTSCDTTTTYVETTCLDTVTVQRFVLIYHTKLTMEAIAKKTAAIQFVQIYP